ncbi:CYTH domain-containing protein [Imhoffiella purpurea]|uniref:CYTH domain-containing protein n=1 Tax=Imhoffiella purpurea TaxID=1249627 RepID=W9V941_9GAMM|nr:CYTH domain-containing protein [Imhoffiella purpurea]EXJ16133.1 hypothetical protein D779_0602 [Imhoffiella purpurea]
MGVEIERKFLVRNEGWRGQVVSETRLLQGYLSSDPNLTVRARVRGESAFLTLKGRSRGISRAEFEYPIPVADAEVMLRDLAVSPLVEKIRYRVACGEQVWDLDVFAGENAGLVMAEIELESEDAPFERPDWLGEEVSDDPRYYNVNLASHPFCRW